MSEFKKNIEEYHDVSLDNIKCAAVNALPAQYRHKPWCITNKGGSDADNTIYTEELQLNAYLASYTDWHKGKLEKAFALLNEPLPRQINIIDFLVYRFDKYTWGSFSYQINCPFQCHLGRFYQNYLFDGAW